MYNIITIYKVSAQYELVHGTGTANTTYIFELVHRMHACIHADTL